MQFSLKRAMCAMTVLLLSKYFSFQTASKSVSGRDDGSLVLK